METAAIIGAIVGAYVTIIGCYVFTFTLWANMNTRVDLLLGVLTKQMADSVHTINLKIDKIADAVSRIEGKHDEQNRKT